MATSPAQSLLLGLCGLSHVTIEMWSVLLVLVYCHCLSHAAQLVDQEHPADRGICEYASEDQESISRIDEQETAEHKSTIGKVCDVEDC